MKKITVTTHTGFPGCVHVDEIEVEDDATEEEIEEACKEVAFERIEWYYEEEEE